MTLHEYVKGMRKDEKEAFVTRCGTNRAYLSQVINGHARPSPEMARKLSEATGWKVHPAEILPEVFGGIPAQKKRRD